MLNRVKGSVLLIWYGWKEPNFDGLKILNKTVKRFINITYFFILQESYSDPN